jgi:hypothetical protein
MFIAVPPDEAESVPDVPLAHPPSDSIPTKLDMAAIRITLLSTIILDSSYCSVPPGKLA